MLRSFVAAIFLLATRVFAASNSTVTVRQRWNEFEFAVNLLDFADESSEEVSGVQIVVGLNGTNAGAFASFQAAVSPRPDCFRGRGDMHVYIVLNSVDRRLRSCFYCDAYLRVPSGTGWVDRATLVQMSFAPTDLAVATLATTALIRVVLPIAPPPDLVSNKTSIPVEVLAVRSDTCIAQTDAVSIDYSFFTLRPVAPVAAVSAGSAHTCHLRVDGSVECWGLGADGRLGYGSLESVAGPGRRVELGQPALAVVAAEGSTCALLQNASVLCWGEGTRGRLGNRGTTNVLDPRFGSPVTIPEPVTAIAAKSQHACALTTSGKVYCWGDSPTGALGYGSYNFVTDPGAAGPVPVGASVSSLAVGRLHTCIVSTTRSVKCWGNGNVGALGYGNTAMVGATNLPSSVGFVSTGASVLQISAGMSHTCAIRDTSPRGVMCWGLGSDGRLGYLGTNNIGDNETPASAGTVNVGPFDVDEVSAGGHHTCVRQGGLRLRCWGRGLQGQLGYGNPFDVGRFNVPNAMDPLFFNPPISRVSAGEFHTCVVVQNDRSLCWGRNVAGSLGLGVPDMIGDDEPIDSVYFLEHMARRGTLELGVIDTARINQIAEVTTGSAHTCVLFRSGNIKCWGSSDSGALTATGAWGVFGDDETIATLPNVHVTGGLRAISVVAGFEHTCAILNEVVYSDYEDRYLRCWGRNGFGQLGLGHTQFVGDDEFPVTTPYVALGLAPYTRVDQVALGIRHTCVLTSEFEVKCFGFGDFGTLGYGNTDTIGDNELPSSVGFVNVDPEYGVHSIAAGSFHNCVIDRTLNVRCWGVNIDGQLGYGHTIIVGDDEHPVDAGVVWLGEGARSLALGAFHTCALLESLALACWGFNEDGQLGLGMTETIGDDEHPSDDNIGWVPLSERVLSVDAGNHYTCVVLESMRVRCWGLGADGIPGLASTETLGDDEMVESQPPIEFDHPVVRVSVGGYHACALLINAQLRCWGFNGFGQLGIESTATIGDNERANEGPVTFVSTTGSLIAPSALFAVLPPSRTWNIPDLNLESSHVRLMPSTRFGIVPGSLSLRFPPRLFRDDLCPGTMEPFGTSRICVYGPSDTWVYENPFVVVHNVSTAGVEGNRRWVDTLGDTLVEVHGEFGWVAMLSDVEITVAGRPCTRALTRTFTTLQCFSPAMVGADLPVTVHLFSSYLPASLPVPATLSTPPPRIDFVTPDIDVSPTGSDPLRIQGRYFGLEGTARVEVDGEECVLLEPPTDNLLRCRPPPSYASPGLVRVRVADQVSTPFAVSFLQPVIVELTPSVLLPSNGNQSVTVAVRGRGFGAGVASLSIGGHACDEASVVNESLVLCAPFRSPAAWTRPDVRLRINDSDVATSTSVTLLPPPTISSVTASRYPTQGGEALRLSGVGFGTSLADVEWVRIGAHRVVPNLFLNQFEVTAMLPAGVGVNVPVSVRTRMGLESAPVPFNYDAPVVESVTPRHALVGDAAASFEVCGRNMGSSLASLNAVVLGGLAMALEGLGEGSAAARLCVRVRVPDTPFPFVEVAATLVSVAVGGQSSLPQEGLFEVVGRPTVSAVAALTKPTAGGVNATVLGTNFGVQAGDVVDVTIGGHSAPLVVFRSRLELTVTLPPGSGHEEVLVVWTRTGSSSSPVAFVRDPPRIVAVEPAVGLAGSQPQFFVLRGENLGLRVEDYDEVRVGGIRCPVIVPLNASAVRCEALVADVTDWPQPSVVEVRVAGRSSGPVPGFFSGLGRPRVTGVSPSEVRENTRLSISGSNFGTSAADVVAVTVANGPCVDLDWESTRLRCSLPATHPLFAMSSPSSNGSDPGNWLPVTVETRTGGFSLEAPKTNADGSVDAVRIVPLAWVDTSLRRPAFSPTVQRVWREPLQPEVVHVEWEVADESLLRLDTDSVRVLSFSLSGAVEANPALLFRGTLLLTDTTPRRVFQGALGVSSRLPIRVSVAAENAFGSGPLSPPSERALEACVPTEFLATHRDEMLWECEDCPAEAACGGLSTSNVTARRGFWRVPWSANALGFALCAREDACRGWTEEFDGVGSNVTTSLDPTATEGCEEGYSGVLCAACESSFYRSVDGSCQPCGSPTLVGLRVTGVVVLFMVLLGVLLIRAFRSAGDSGSDTVRTLKILFNHFQTIAIISSIRFRWPAALTDAFAVSNTSSSFSTEGVSLECVMGDAGKSPLDRSLVLLSMPFWLFLYATVFWFLGVWTPTATLLDRVQRQFHASFRGTIVASRVQRDARTQWLRRMKVSVPVLIFLVHTNVTKAAFQMVTCRAVAPENDPSNAQLRLAMDLDTRCDDPANLQWMVGVSVPVLLLFSLGVPTLTTTLLHRFRSQLQEPEIRRLFGFLFAGYRDGLEGWEGVNALRKVLLAGVTVVLGPFGAFNQVAAALVVITLASTVHAWMKPYRERRFNILEGGSLVTATLTMIMGLFLEASESDEVAWTVQTIIFVSNASVILLSLRTLWEAKSLAASSSSTSSGRRASRPSIAWLKNPVKRSAPPSSPPAPASSSSSTSLTISSSATPSSASSASASSQPASSAASPTSWTVGAPPTPSATPVSPDPLLGAADATPVPLAKPRRVSMATRVGRKSLIRT